MSLEITTQFSLRNARELAAFASQAYDGRPTIACDKTDTQVVITELPEALVIAFRGTSNLHDFITDASCWLKPNNCVQRPTTLIGNQKVHNGFLEAIDSVLGDVGAAARDTVKPIFITGHSLGGALAMLCADALASEGIDPHGVYTFGQPRVGNRAFADAYDAKVLEEHPVQQIANDYAGTLEIPTTLRDVTFRFVHEEDIVPRVPWLMGRYRHAGKEVFLPSTGGMEVDPSLLAKFVSDAWGFYQAYRRVNLLAADEMLKDHHIANYIADLKQLTP